MPSLFAELPYREDTVALFETIADEPWAVFLDSGRHLPGHSRFDILAADPAATLVTRGNMTEIRGRTGTALSPDDPFALVRRHLGTPIAPHPTIPFCGGAIGYFAYDLGRRLERLPVIAEDVERIPEMAVGIYDWACVVDHHERRTWLVGAGREPETQRRWGDLIRAFSEPARERYRTPFRVTSSIASNLTPDGYARAFRRIQQYIANGDCYQVNLAQRFAAAATGDPWLAYQALRILNPAPFAAYLNLRFVQVLSASPERFLRVRDGLVETKPIKGTRPRAGHPRLDAALAEVLKESDKDRAENVMIVDLLRNDLSKTCELGSVKVPKLFDVESFATVHHLVSTVTGELRPEFHAVDLLRGCFPGRLDHGRAEAARDGNHRGAGTPPARRLLRRHRLSRVRRRDGYQHRDPHPGAFGRHRALLGRRWHRRRLAAAGGVPGILRQGCCDAEVAAAERGQHRATLTGSGPNLCTSSSSAEACCARRRICATGCG